MGIFSWLRKSSYEADFHEVSVDELADLAVETQVRRLALAVCTNMTANALGRAVLRTFENGREVRGIDHYTWNIRPNPNETGTQFWHKVVCSLMTEGEALLVMRQVAGQDCVWVASGFELEQKQRPFAPNRWVNVSVNDVPVGRTLPDDEVLHISAGAVYPGAALAALADTQCRLINVAQKSLRWQMGQHIKVHLDRMAQGDKEFNQTFQAIVEAQIKPFLDSENAALPEYDGWDYQMFGQEKNGARLAEVGREIRKMIDDVFDFTARACLIPPVLVSGEVADSKDAVSRWLTVAIDPLAETIADEINRKCYGPQRWLHGDYLRVDTSGLQHFDLFANAGSVEKLVGSGWSYNDIQRAIGGNEIDAEWANEHYFTKNFASVKDGKGVNE